MHTCAQLGVRRSRWRALSFQQPLDNCANRTLLAQHEPRAFADDPQMAAEVDAEVDKGIAADEAV